MDVTATNFLEVLPKLEAAIASSAFIAIDTELTGLTADAAPTDAFCCEDPAERYTRLRSTDFLIVQFGVCPVSPELVAQPYNLFVFPRQFSRDSPDPRFLCQASCLRFLASVGFDFQRLFSDGIPFMSPERAEEERRRLRARRERKPPQPESDSDKAFLGSVVKRVADWLAAPESATSPLRIDPCNSYQRALIHGTIPAKFPDVVLGTENGQQAQRGMTVTKVDPAERRELERRKAEDEERELELAIGFTKVLDAISRSRKPLVGHNMLLDLTNTAAQFFGPLPDDLPAYKALISSHFPVIYDTKFMSSCTDGLKASVSDTSLEALTRRLGSAPFGGVPELFVPPEFSKYNSSEESNFHEAGFDALMTAEVFVHLCYYHDKASLVNNKLHLDTQVIKNLANKVALGRSLCTYLTMDGADVVPDTRHILYVSHFPKEWNVTALKSKFAEFGDVFVRWATDTTAFLLFSDETTATKAAEEFRDRAEKAVTAGKQPICTVVTLAEYKTTRPQSPSTPIPQRSPRP